LRVLLRDIFRFGTAMGPLLSLINH